MSLSPMRADLGRRGSDKIALVRVGHTVEARLEDCSFRTQCLCSHHVIGCILNSANQSFNVQTSEAERVAVAEVAQLKTGGGDVQSAGRCQ